MTVVQAGWVLRLLLPEDVGLAGFGVLAAGELLVPAWAESAAPTTWHPGHIVERYGLFTIIVLGESILAASLAIQQAIDADELNTDLALIVAGGLLIVFSMWWLYFHRSGEDLLTPFSGQAALLTGVVLAALLAVKLARRYGAGEEHESVGA